MGKGKRQEGIRSRCDGCEGMVVEGAAHNCPGSGPNVKKWTNPHAGDPGTDWSKQPPAKPE